MPRRRTPAAGEEAPKKFLSYERYVERFARDIASLQRLWLVPLALAAFWLAIENSYQSFKTLLAENQMLEREQDQEQKSQETLTNRRVETERSARAAIAPVNPDLRDDARERALSEHRRALEIAVAEQVERGTRSQRQRVDDQQERVKQRDETVRRLKQEAVNLQVVGTQMPSRLNYAPTLWLTALLAWLLYFESLRARAQKQLAAAVADYGPKPAPFGVAADSSVWITPIPDEILLRVSHEPGSERVTRTEMLTFLGWSAADDQRSWHFALLAWAVLAALVVRVLWIAAMVNSQTALDVSFTSGVGALLNTGAVALLVPLCLWALWSLAFVAPETRDQDLFFVRRELFRLGGPVLTLAVLMNATKAIALFRGQASERPKAAAEAVPRSPRFISRQVKNARRQRRRVQADGARPGELFVTLPPARDGGLAAARIFRGASRDGRVRFHSATAGLNRLRRLAPEPFRRLTENLQRRRAPDTVAAASLEAAALAFLEQRKLGPACDILMGACRLTIAARRPNLRVFDLLMGLAVRYPPATAYRDEILRSLEQLRATQLHSEPLQPLFARERAWRTEGWGRRWRSPRPIMWGHPFDTQESATRRSFLGWSESIKKRALMISLPPHVRVARDQTNG
jgi:hypothetical protein